jgi:hypothetical protein
MLIGCAKSKKERVGLCLIWNVFMCVIWSVGNGVILNNVTVMVDEVVDKIKMLS